MTSQSFANHRRWHPPFHFFVLPVMLINFFWSVLLFVRSPGRGPAWAAVVALALVLAVLFIRTNSLKVQDRVIRLEERLRYQSLLPTELMPRALNLTPRQIVAMRFAADEELNELVNAVVAGQLTTPNEIKQAIKNWRADTFRV
jgi:hypothetical protein